MAPVSLQYTHNFQKRKRDSKNGMGGVSKSVVVRIGWENKGGRGAMLIEVTYGIRYVIKTAII